MDQKPTEEKRFVCVICERSFSRIHRLQSHMLSHKKKKMDDGSSPTDVSDTCEIVLQPQNEKSVDETNSVGSIVEFDNKIWENSGESNEIASSDENMTVLQNDYMEKKGYCSCEMCGKTFSSKSFLDRHILSHTKEKPYVCDICCKGFSQMGNLKVHKLTHSNTRSHECYVCGKNFTQFAYLKAHVLTHLHEKPYTCTVCNKGFTSKCFLKRHGLIHTKEKPYKCDVCGRGFAQRGNLKVHFLTHTVKDKHCVCDVCNKSFSRQCYLDKHYQIHEKNQNLSE